MRRHLLAFLTAIAFAFVSTPAIADIPISGLPAAPSVLCGDLFVTVHSGTTSQATGCQVWQPNGPLIFNGAGAFGTASQTWIAQDGGANAGITSNVPASSTNGYRWTVNNALVAALTAAGVFSATSFSGSGAGLTAGTVPNAALVTTPLTATTGLDLVSAQTAGGVKTFSSAPVMSGASITSATIPLTALATTPLSAPGGVGTLASPLSFLRNLLINGGMNVTQYGTSSVTPGGGVTYTVDRWAYTASVASKFSTAPENLGAGPLALGLSHALGFTSLSAYTPLSTDQFSDRQIIEANNLGGIAFGTASAKSLALSFWARSSLTGTFGGATCNDAGTRCYAFTYSVPVANVFTPESSIIPGDTSGTWNLVGTGPGLILYFSLGAGSSREISPGAWTTTTNQVAPTGMTNVVATNAASFELTNVQLETGANATPFEQRPYATELSLAQRYASVMSAANTSATTAFATGFTQSTAAAILLVNLPVQMRTIPTLSTTGTFRLAVLATTATATAPSISQNGLSAIQLSTATSGVTAGQGCFLQANNDATAALIFSAEL